MNCFQICIFVSDDTASARIASAACRLWIAFKFVSLYRMTQLTACKASTPTSCELLSNLYLCIGWHSKCFCSCSRTRVVNCFQICIFVSDDTAPQRPLCRPCRLWIAFKFVSLYRMTQQMIGSLTRYFGCELLSNLYLCIGWHSSAISDIMINSVVNCFQICIFVSDDTAVEDETGSWSVLWIAFKFVSLYRMTQPSGGTAVRQWSCELLSNLYLCIGWHSFIIKTSNYSFVVNCFQICIFVSDDTACITDELTINVLWIAFKFVSLYRMTQHTTLKLDADNGCELLSNLYLCIGWHSP